MKILKAFLIFIFVFSFLTPSYSAPSENLEKVKIPQIYRYEIEKYVRNKFKWNVPKSGVSDEEIRIAAEMAGWSAFNQNFGIYGASATIMEECLGAAFLNSTNSALGEVGGALVLIQLVFDVASGDYKAANINFGKGTLGYVIGKWGTRAMKIGAAGAVAIELFLTAVASKWYQMHDDAYYLALNRYFTRWSIDKRDVGEWLRVFNSGEIKTPDDILKIVDEYVDKHIGSQDFILFLGGEKDYAETAVALDSGRYGKFKKHFKDYVKNVLIFPYIEALFNKLNEDNIERQAGKIIENFESVAEDLNKEYTIDGTVKGPKEKIQGLTVRIPGFLETTTDSKGKFKLRFTLYSLFKSNIDLPSRIELWIPKEDSRSYTLYAKKRFKVKDKHRETGIIKGGFSLEAKKLHIVADNLSEPWTKWDINGRLDFYIDQENEEIYLSRNHTATMPTTGKPVVIHHSDKDMKCILNSRRITPGGKVHFNIVNFRYDRSQGNKPLKKYIVINMTVDPETGQAEGTYGIYLSFSTISIKFKGSVVEGSVLLKGAEGYQGN